MSRNHRRSCLIFFPGRPDGCYHLNFLKTNLPILLENVALLLRNQLLSMNYGAPTCFSVLPREILNQVYPNKWISRDGPQPWPSKSPDLNGLEFFLWGNIKSLVYTPVENKEDFISRIIGVSNTVWFLYNKRVESYIMIGRVIFYNFLNFISRSFLGC